MGELKSDSEIAYDSVYFNESMTDQEKSVLLAKASELEIEYEPIALMTYAHSGMGQAKVLETLCPNLYAPANMALAWRVLNWWHGKWWPHAVGKPHENWYAFDNWWQGIVGWGFEPQELQRAMLDKILELCIEAHIVREE